MSKDTTRSTFVYQRRCSTSYRTQKQSTVGRYQGFEKDKPNEIKQAPLPFSKEDDDSKLTGNVTVNQTKAIQTCCL